MPWHYGRRRLRLHRRRVRVEARVVRVHAGAVTSTLCAAIVGLAGPVLDDVTAARLRTGAPAGVILFARNIVAADQLVTLTGQLRSVLPRGAVLMVDQEGGRVARLRPPHWRAYPACGALGSERAAWLQGALIGAEARAAGFDVVCAPVLDVRHPGASDVVGDRAFSEDPATVSRLGLAMAEGLLAAGVQPVAKHAPGHGRARSDSHSALPVVDGLDPDDLLPFAAAAHLPWWMTAHVVFRGIDDRPATCSRTIISDLIRGRLGFRGVLVSDDLAMGALDGAPEARARAAWDAGCDLVLYCAGDPAGTEAVLRAAPALSATAQRGMAAAAALAQASRRDLDVATLSAERDAFLAAMA